MNKSYFYLEDKTNAWQIHDDFSQDNVNREGSFSAKVARPVSDFIMSAAASDLICTPPQFEKEEDHLMIELFQLLCALGNF